MNKINRLVRSIATRFVEDSLFRNSIFLMLSTAVMGGLGFFFWLINARLYTTQDIGIATTLISIMSLISTISLFGFNTVYVRFLASSKDPNRELNSGLTIVATVSAIISTAFIIATPWISPSLTFLKDNPALAASFVIFMIASSLNMITDSVFIAHRSAHYNLLVNTVMSLTKLILPPFLLAFGAYGIFMAASIGACLDLALSLYLIVHRFGYHLAPSIDLGVVRSTFRFFISNYFAGLLTILPVLILPIMVLNRLGPSSAAFYYIDMMIVNLLYVIPFASAQSLFAEGSYDEAKLISHAKKAAKLNLLLIGPASLVLLLAGHFVLSVYGHSYASDGTILLQILVLSAVFVTANYIYAAMFKVTQGKLAIIIMSALGATSILLLSNAFVSMGLVGIGLAWLIGNAISATFAAAAYHSGFLRHHSARLLKVLI